MFVVIEQDYRQGIAEACFGPFDEYEKAEEAANELRTIRKAFSFFAVFEVQGMRRLRADEREADARLIAAAPDLLDLARNIAGLDQRYVHGVMAGALREYQEQARAAIAKATGAEGDVE